MPRPLRIPSAGRMIQWCIRVTPRSKAYLQARAKEKGMTIGEYIDFMSAKNGGWLPDHVDEPEISQTQSGKGQTKPGQGTDWTTCDHRWVVSGASTSIKGCGKCGARSVNGNVSGP